MGGSPFRLIRLSKAGSATLDRWLDGDAVESSKATDALLERLLAASMVHPVLEPGNDQKIPSVSFVVPVYEDASGLDELLTVLRREFVFVEIVVVDDCSSNGASIGAVAEAHDAHLVRLDTNRGPAAARNAGWRHLASPGSRYFPDVTFFLDADVVPASGSLHQTLVHLCDPAVGGAAPRVRAEPGLGVLDSYEALSSPLDLGVSPSIVRPGARASYVPSAALAVRTQVLIGANGFDENMRFGEDVDLIWRLVDQGHTIRYEPRAVVHHRNRASLSSLLKQRFGYGSSAAPLAKRHGDKVTPLRMPASILAGWTAALFGGRLGLLAGLGGWVWSLRTLATKFEGKVDAPVAEAARTLTTAHVGVASGLVNASNRHYLPLMLLTRSARRFLALGAVVPPLVRWIRRRPSHDPVRHILLKSADDASYAAGVWAGAWRERSIAALLPDVQRVSGPDG